MVEMRGGVRKETASACLKVVLTEIRLGDAATPAQKAGTWLSHSNSEGLILESLPWTVMLSNVLSALLYTPISVTTFISPLLFSFTCSPFCTLPKLLSDTSRV